MCTLCSFAARYQKSNKSNTLLRTTQQFSSMVMTKQLLEPAQQSLSVDLSIQQSPPL